jgi:hypothetical protein
MHRTVRNLAIGLLATAVALSGGGIARADIFTPGNLLVSRSVYPTDPSAASIVMVGQTLPGGGTATADGTYPNVFNNNKVDGSFGVTTPIFIDQITPSGAHVSTVAVPTTLVNTSFSSKSELGLNLSADGHSITFMAYTSPARQLDVSNSNTPGVVDPTNPVKSSTYRAVVQLDATGNFTVTTTNAYSGNNGRNAILAANGLYYTVGNAGNGSNPQPPGILAGAGTAVLTPGQSPPPLPPSTQAGSFDITQTNPLTGKPYAPKPDKPGKDNNFRGETIFNNTLYVTKGSGGNGINTVYQVGTAGTLPAAGTNTFGSITVLPGFPAGLATNISVSNPSTLFFPFGIWFANSTTLYVGDEGTGNNTSTDNPTTNPHAGLQKWSLVNGVWQLDYTLQNGLQLGVPYVVTDPVSGNSYFPTETDGLRNITGIVNSDGTVTIYGVTSTVSASGDQGADPNRLVAITDNLSFTTSAQAANESFTTIDSAAYGEVLRGVTFVPLSAPEPSTMALFGVGSVGLLAWRRWRRKSA